MKPPRSFKKSTFTLLMAFLPQYSINLQHINAREDVGELEVSEDWRRLSLEWQFSTVTLGMYRPTVNK